MDCNEMDPIPGSPKGFIHTIMYMTKPKNIIFRILIRVSYILAAIVIGYILYIFLVVGHKEPLDTMIPTAPPLIPTPPVVIPNSVVKPIQPIQPQPVIT
jgi:hypothetical protein